MVKQPAFSISDSNSQAGFSLVELAVALMVTGLLMGLSLPMLQVFKQRSISIRTYEHQKTIHAALKTYQQTHPSRILPCPADPAAFGEERGVAHCVMGRQEGIVPYKSLGLSESVAKDGYNRYFTYVVEHNLTRPMDDFDTIKGGHVQVTDIEGHPVIDPGNPHNFVSILLISHGSSGGGAYDNQGKRIPFVGNPSPTKEINANGHPHYQAGGEDSVFWVSQIAFRSASCPH